MNLSHINKIKFSLGVVLGSLIACSPSRFTQSQQAANICDSSVSKCITESGFINITQNYQVGSGKVDILFVTDNSASMSKIQLQMASKFSGFIQSLDNMKADYRIAITTTDLSAVSNQNLISLGNGKKYITSSDSDRVILFNNGVVRNETVVCEDFINSMFYTYGKNFQNADYNPSYSTMYYQKCPSSDTRGIYTANLVVSSNKDEFIRSDANLFIILISNDNVRQGKAMEENDKASTFINMMNQKYPNKYWDFNSIVVKDSVCMQSQFLYNANNQLVMNNYGPAIAGGIGIEYANLSNSAAKDIEGNARPRGQVLNICETDYSQHFNSMSTQISEEARMVTLKCLPDSEPVVTLSSQPNTNVSFTLNGSKLIFPRSMAGQSVDIQYRCYTGPT